MSFILTGIGGILFLYGLYLSYISNFNLGVVLVIALGVLLLSWGVFYKKIARATSKGVGKYIKYTVIAVLAVEICIVSFTAIYGRCDNVTYKEDAVIVLGAGIRGDRVTLPLKYRLDKAVEYAEKNKDALIVVSGGQGFQETVTEAYAMEKYLMEQGVPKERIIKEEKSASTNENMRFSKVILDEKLGNDYRVAVITNNFHIYRGVQIAKAEGFENVTHMHAPLQWYNLLPCYLRESLAILKMWVIG